MIKQILIPELDVSDLERSVEFYTKVLGCTVLYERPDERFVMLDFAGAQLMLEEANGPGRRFRTAPLEKPYGRGVNFQILVADLETLYKNVLAVNAEIIVPMEERWYRRCEIELGNRQFVVADPDGYLLRLFNDLGERDVEGCKR